MKTYTPLQLQSIVAQLRNVRVNGDPVFRVSVEPTALSYRKRLVLDNGDTIANLELELTPRQGGAWDGVLARYGDEENPIDYKEAVAIARKRIGETVPGYYRGEEWIIIDTALDAMSKCVRAVVVDKAVYEVLKEFEQKEDPQGLASRLYREGKIANIPARLPLSEQEQREREKLGGLFSSGKPLSEIVIEDRGERLESHIILATWDKRDANGSILTREAAIKLAAQAIGREVNDTRNAHDYTIVDTVIDEERKEVRAVIELREQ